MLTDADRALGHRLAGEWLEQAGERATRGRSPSTSSAAGSPRAAAAWYRRAAEQALEGNDLDAVLARAGRALASGASDVTKGALLAMQGYVHTWRTQYADAAACYAEALPELIQGSVHWHLAIGGALHANASIGDFARVAGLIETLRTGLLEDRSPIAPLQGMSAAVPILCVAGQYDLARDFIRRFSISEPPRSDDPAAREPVTPASAQYPGAAGPDVARCHYAFFAMGDAWALRRHARRALKLGKHAGEGRVIHMAQLYEAVALWKLGDAEQGVRRLARGSGGRRGAGAPPRRAVRRPVPRRRLHRPRRDRRGRGPAPRVRRARGGERPLGGGLVHRVGADRPPSPRPRRGGGAPPLGAGRPRRDFPRLRFARDRDPRPDRASIEGAIPIARRRSAGRRSTASTRSGPGTTTSRSASPPRSSSWPPGTRPPRAGRSPPPALGSRRAPRRSTTQPSARATWTPCRRTCARGRSWESDRRGRGARRRALDLIAPLWRISVSPWLQRSTCGSSLSACSPSRSRSGAPAPPAARARAAARARLPARAAATAGGERRAPARGHGRVLGRHGRRRRLVGQRRIDGRGVHRPSCAVSSSAGGGAPTSGDCQSDADCPGGQCVAAHPRRLPRLPGAAVPGDELHGPARPVLPRHAGVLPERRALPPGPPRADLLGHPPARAQPVRRGSVREGHRLRAEPDLRARRHPRAPNPGLRHRLLQDRRGLRGVPGRRLRARPRALLLDQRRPLLRLPRPRRLPLGRRLPLRPHPPAAPASAPPAPTAPRPARQARRCALHDGAAPRRRRRRVPRRVPRAPRAARATRS